MRTFFSRLSTHRVVPMESLPTRAWKRNKVLSVNTNQGRWVACWRDGGGVRSWSWTVRKMGSEHLSVGRLE